MGQPFLLCKIFLALHSTFSNKLFMAFGVMFCCFQQNTKATFETLQSDSSLNWLLDKKLNFFE